MAVLYLGRINITVDRVAVLLLPRIYYLCEWLCASLHFSVYIVGATAVVHAVETKSANNGGCFDREVARFDVRLF